MLRKISLDDCSTCPASFDLSFIERKFEMQWMLISAMHTHLQLNQYGLQQQVQTDIKIL